MSIRFNEGDQFDSAARIDEVLSRGDHDAMSALFNTLMVDPQGAVAQRVVKLCDARLDRDDDELAERDLLLAARHLVLGFRNFKRVRP